MLQRKAIRIVNQADYYEPSNPLFIRLYTLKLEDLVNLNTAVIVYKAHTSMMCPGAVRSQQESIQIKGHVHV